MKNWTTLLLLIWHRDGFRLRLNKLGALIRPRAIIFHVEQSFYFLPH